MALFYKKNAASRRDRGEGKTAANWLEHDARRGRLLETAEQFNLIQGLIAQALQLPVGHACRVVGLDNGTLIIAVPSAAHAAKIRQLTTTIHQLLVAKGQRVDQIRIKIQAGLRSSVSTTAAAAPNTRHALGEQARGALLELQQSTDNQQLAETLARILEKNQARRQS
ncbi:hypothetical protein MIM_c09830 [Advenella mimigardefordensis DPN7]|uniref:DUF721 domain-containing protein n=1 Tax=Advenella mimigardefordensis (strain DSM 17166 / LMG 22922 / DPN7) TaxID=1247726 RepID=W0PC70_ADVMD|nr:hypothetical protein MIM_c09830 [Advenella mimigardefordensis DPN7]